MVERLFQHVLLRYKRGGLRVEARNDTIPVKQRSEALHFFFHGLLRFARNDGCAKAPFRGWGVSGASIFSLLP